MLTLDLLESQCCIYCITYLWGGQAERPGFKTSKLNASPQAHSVAASLGSRFKQRGFPWFDLGIAAEHFCLQAAAEGLGACMLGWFDEEKEKSLLGIPSARRVGLIISFGYPSEGRIRPKKRKTLHRLVLRERYRGR